MAVPPAYLGPLVEGAQGPLDLIVMDPTTGPKMEGGHERSVIKAIAAEVLPNLSQHSLVRADGFRRFGVALAQITKAPAQDPVGYGGWAAGVPTVLPLWEQRTELLVLPVRVACSCCCLCVSVGRVPAVLPLCEQRAGRLVLPVCAACSCCCPL